MLAMSLRLVLYAWRETIGFDPQLVVVVVVGRLYHLAVSSDRLLSRSGSTKLDFRAGSSTACILVLD